MNEYLQERWRNLSPEAKKLLNIPEDNVVMMFTEMMWRLQYVRSLTDE